MKAAEETQQNNAQFSGDIYIFQAFDIGDDLDLEELEISQVLHKQQWQVPKYFKGYHTPLSVELPHPHERSTCFSTRLHSFGAISFIYKIPFNSTLEELRENITEIDNQYQEQSVTDAHVVFKKIAPFVTQPKFFHLRTSYVLIEVDKESNPIGSEQLKKDFGQTIASLVRFETESLSDYQKNEILENDIGYYRGDIALIEPESAFVYGDEDSPLLDLFEFANIQQLELKYFDRLLDNQLNLLYERKVRPVSWKAYLPFIGMKLSGDYIGELGRLRVDISVITEQLESSVKFVGDPFYTEIYEDLSEQLDLQNWRDSISKKLSIIQDVRTVYQYKIDSNREDLLTVAIIVLIVIELLVAFFKP